MLPTMCVFCCGVEYKDYPKNLTFFNYFRINHAQAAVVADNAIAAAAAASTVVTMLSFFVSVVAGVCHILKKMEFHIKKSCMFCS